VSDCTALLLSICLQHTLVLLGSGESGKSTVLKQLLTSFGGGFPDATRSEYLAAITANVVLNMKILLRESVKLDAQHQTRYATALNEDAASILALALTAADSSKPHAIVAPTRLTPELAKHINSLWQDAGIQATYALRRLFYLPDTAAYFFGQHSEQLAA
jgi:guanine nucleotide-binding protein G(i) subunit alpha